MPDTLSKVDRCPLLNSVCKNKMEARQKRGIVVTGEKKHKVIPVLFYGGVGVAGIVIGILGLVTTNPEPVNPVLIGVGMGIVAMGGIVAGVSLLQKRPAAHK